MMSPHPQIYHGISDNNKTIVTSDRKVLIPYLYKTGNWRANDIRSAINVFFVCMVYDAIISSILTMIEYTNTTRMPRSYSQSEIFPHTIPPTRHFQIIPRLDIHYCRQIEIYLLSEHVKYPDIFFHLSQVEWESLTVKSCRETVQLPVSYHITKTVAWPVFAAWRHRMLWNKIVLW